jgi:hypothetical protein
MAKGNDRKTSDTRGCWDRFDRKTVLYPASDIANKYVAIGLNLDEYAEP